MIPHKPAGHAVALDLSHLSGLCRAAGAVAFTVIQSSEKVVVFDRDPQRVGFETPGSYDELHIQPEQNSSMLIAVFRGDRQA